MTQYIPLLVWESNQCGGPPNTKYKPHHRPPGPSNMPPRRPCTLCSMKGFRDNHFPLNQHCTVPKLSSKNILQLISDPHVCPTCTHSHGSTFKCKLVFYNRAPKVCPKECKHKGIPVHARPACTTVRPPQALLPRCAPTDLFCW